MSIGIMACHRQHTTTQLLEFENEIVLEMYQENALLVLCEGLSFDRIFLHFLHLYSDVKELIFVLNTDQMQQEYYVEKLKSFGIAALPKALTSECNAAERTKLYASGGVFFMSSRILVMDMLMDRIPIHLVSGLLINKAHKLADSSQEPFIMRLFRQKNKLGFIKAFTDNPSALVGEYGKLERILKNLFVGKVFLWPRFHSSIIACLEKHKPEVIEINVNMTSSMRLIQTAVLEIVGACLRELKQSNPGIETDEFTLENCLGKSFDHSLHAQLDPVWNQLGYKSKHLVWDLRLLRLLLRALSQYDCVTFLKILESSSGTQKAFGQNPGWLFLDASNTLFTHARYRVHGDQSKTSNESKKDKSSKEECDTKPLLEENPKWEALTEILNEINEVNLKTSLSELGEGKVLICVSDMREIYMLRNILKCGSRSMLLHLYKELFNKNNFSCSSSKDNIMTAANEMVQSRSVQKTVSQEMEVVHASFLAHHHENQHNKLKVFEKPETYLQALHGDPDPYSLTKTLEKLEPRYVILYDSSVHFVRQLEIYKACRPGMPLRIYFITYDSSAEEQIYLTALRKEKESFHSLIQEKSAMIVPKEREGKLETYSSVDNSLNVSEISSEDRKLDDQRTIQQVQQTVIVDMREFRSELPSLLHRKGLNINPITIEVGDYVLTPDICVERKSLSDLIGSLNSGRLYKQCVAMSRHYKQPVLLIEFDSSKAFSFRARGIAGAGLSVKGLNEKLTLLLLHFTKLRLAWCSSPSAAAHLFCELKLLRREQPDPTKAVTIGIEENDALSGQLYNSSPYDFLLELPGINLKNCKRILHSVKNLQELCTLSQSQLTAVLDSKINADQLYSFLHKRWDVTNERKSVDSRSKFKRPFSGRATSGKNAKK